MKLWAGRFQKETDTLVNDFNSSIGFDARLYKQDIQGSIAHAAMLGRQGIIEEHEAEKIINGLKTILSEIEGDGVEFSLDNEDIHMNIEAMLTQRIGDAGKRLHTARSRNDQVAVDTRLYVKEEIPVLIGKVLDLERVLVKKAKAHLDTVMPGLVGHDFGDAIRFAANFVEEDSPEAEKAGLNLNIYWAFVEGFLKETAPTLTEAEAETLGNSCFTLACELATRFLDDYITGDKYFKIHSPQHNLVRTRCQIALAKDMQKKMNAMNAIVRDCWMRYRGK